MNTLEMYYQNLAKRNRPMNSEEDELLRQKALDMYNDRPFGTSARPAKMTHKPSEYEDGSMLENIAKTTQLKSLSKMDPAQDRRISALTNQFVARAANNPAWQPTKDLYALGQDAYLLEAGRAGLLRGGLREAKKMARR